MIDVTGMILLANSLVDGFFQSNGIGQGIVVLQIVASFAMVTCIIGKWRELHFIESETRRFLNDFSIGEDVLEYYLKRRPVDNDGIIGLYRETCDRLLKLFNPNVRSLLVGHDDGEGRSSTLLTAREIELVRGTCEHALDEEENRIEKGMSVIATVVSLSPMLGLLGTVWGVLDAFAEMGSAGSANLATIAPSISSALVTTVVGLIVAIPGVIAFNVMNGMIRSITSDMEGFADELTGRIACEFQGKGL